MIDMSLLLAAVCKTYGTMRDGGYRIYLPNSAVNLPPTGQIHQQQEFDLQGMSLLYYPNTTIEGVGKAEVIDDFPLDSPPIEVETTLIASGGDSLESPPL